MSTPNPANPKKARPPTGVEHDRKVLSREARADWPPVVARVELAPGATVAFEFDGEEPDVLDPETVTGLFRAGLHATPRRPRGKPDGSARLVLDGEARFLAGTWDLGRKRGMNVVLRGLTYVLAVVDSTGAQDALLPAKPSPAPPPAVDRAVPRAASRVAVSELGGSFEGAFVRARAGQPVVVTDLDEPTVVVVDWRWYCRQRALLTQLDTANWVAWSSGEFNGDAYAAALADLRSATPPTAEPTAAPSPVGGNHDDR